MNAIGKKARKQTGKNRYQLHRSDHVVTSDEKRGRKGKGWLADHVTRSRMKAMKREKPA